MAAAINRYGALPGGNCRSVPFRGSSARTFALSLKPNGSTVACLPYTRAPGTASEGAASRCDWRAFRGVKS